MPGPIAQFIRDQSDTRIREQKLHAPNDLLSYLPQWFRDLASGGANGATAGNGDLGAVGLASIGSRPILPPALPRYTRPQVPSDLYNGPYKGPDELDNYSGETPFMRLMFRKLYASVPELVSAIDGKVNALAAAPVSVQPEDASRKEDRENAELFRWCIEESEDGWDGLIRAATIGMFIDGWSVVEPTFGGGAHPKLGVCTTLQYSRGIDTQYLRLEIDQYRRVMGIVSLRRGLEVFDPSQAMIFTHREWYSNPFGNSDVRPVYQTALMIEDAFRLWDFSLKYFGMPYVHAKAKNPQMKQQMEGAVAALRSLNYIVTGVEDQVELLNLAASTGFDQFKQNIESKRERIYAAIRGAYLPFVQGQAGADRRGDTKVHESASDAAVDIIAKQLARGFRRGLAKKITEFNYPTAGVPTITIGGKNWDDTKTFVDLWTAAKSSGEKLSKKQFHQETGLAPPEDESDVSVAQGGGDASGKPGGTGDAGAGPDGAPPVPGPGAPPDGGPSGGSGGPEKPPVPEPVDPPLAATTLPNNGADTVGSVPPAPFLASEARNYAKYFMPDARGRFPGELHEQFGVSVPVFSYLTGLKRRQVIPKGAKAEPRWHWQGETAAPNGPLAAPGPNKGEQGAVIPENGGTQAPTEPPPGAEDGTVVPPELLAAMLQAKLDGDDHAVDELAELGGDPEALQEFLADQDAGTQGMVGAQAFAGFVKKFSAFAAETKAAPKVAGLAVRAADTGRVLLLKRAEADGDPASGKWEFPGGHLKAGESPHGGAIREFVEETGIPSAALAGKPAVASWHSPNGIYAGRVVEVPTETEIEEARGPGDQDEALGWIHPADLDHADVRAELRADLPRILPVLRGEPQLKLFGWFADPTPRSKSRVTNSDSGAHAYGERGRSLLAYQRREDRGDPHPVTPKQLLIEHKQKMEGRREEARKAFRFAMADPSSVRPKQLKELAEHMHTLTRDEMRQSLRDLEKKTGGKLKHELVDSLLEHVKTRGAENTAALEASKQKAKEDDGFGFGMDEMLGGPRAGDAGVKMRDALPHEHRMNQRHQVAKETGKVDTGSVRHIGPLAGHEITPHEPSPREEVRPVEPKKAEPKGDDLPVRYMPAAAQVTKKGGKEAEQPAAANDRGQASAEQPEQSEQPTAESQSVAAEKPPASPPPLASQPQPNGYTQEIDNYNQTADHHAEEAKLADDEGDHAAAGVHRAAEHAAREVVKKYQEIAKVEKEFKDKTAKAKSKSDKKAAASDKNIASLEQRVDAAKAREEVAKNRLEELRGKGGEKSADQTAPPTASPKPLKQIISDTAPYIDQSHMPDDQRRRLISHAYDKAKESNPNLTLDDFKKHLLDAHKAGHVSLSRADLPQSMTPEDVQRSQINHQNAEFHLVHPKGWASDPKTFAQDSEGYEHAEAGSGKGGQFVSKGDGGGGGSGTKSRSENPDRLSDVSAKKAPATRGEMTGAKREGKGKDAKVVLANGKPAPAHIKPSMIPPQWTDVNVSLDPSSDLQVTGRDSKGRPKAVYRDEFHMRNAAIKFARVQEGLKKADEMYEQNQANRSDPKTRDSADCVWLMQEQATRPGNDADTGAKVKAYGATTLEGQHVVKTKDGVRLQFIGKEGVYHDHLIRNPELAKMLLERKKKAGEDGKLFPETNYAKVTEYTKTRLDSGRFTPKDFRTMKATRLAIQSVNETPAPKTEKEYKTAIKSVAEKVSNVLGNRPQQALESYIAPEVFSGWRASLGTAATTGK